MLMIFFSPGNILFFGSLKGASVFFGSGTSTPIYLCLQGIFFKIIHPPPMPHFSWKMFSQHSSVQRSIRVNKLVTELM